MDIVIIQMSIRLSYCTLRWLEMRAELFCNGIYQYSLRTISAHERLIWRKTPKHQSRLLPHVPSCHLTLSWHKRKQCPAPVPQWMDRYSDTISTSLGLSTFFSSPVAHIPCSFQPHAKSLPSTWNKQNRFQIHMLMNIKHCTCTSKMR